MRSGRLSQRKWSGGGVRVIVVAAAALGLCLGLTACSKQARKERHFAKANRAYQAGQYDKAEIEYLNVLQVPPAHPVALTRLGEIYYEQGRVIRAYTYLRAATELDPQNVEARAKLGLIYSFLHQGKDAEEAADKVLQKQPANEDALLVLSNAGLTTNEIRRVREKIVKLQQANPDRASYHLALGTIDLRQGDRAAAETAFNQALAMEPRSSAVHAALANLCLARHDPTNAGAHFQASADLAPTRSTRRLKLVEFKLDTGAVAQARKLLEELTAKAPDYLPAWSYLAQLSLAENKYDEAAALVKKVLAREPTDYEALMLDANLKLVKGHFAEAVAVLTRMSTLFERSPQVHYRLGYAHRLAGDTSKAENELTQAIILEPNYAEAVLLLSEIRVAKGAAGQAVTPLLQLVKQQPQILRGHLLLGTAYTAQNNFEEALAIYLRAEKMFPRSPEPPWLAGMMLARLKKPEEARKHWESSLQLAPDYLLPLERLVDLQLEQKDYPGASERVQKEIQRRPKVAELQLLLAKVYLAQEDFKTAETTLRRAIELAPDQPQGYMVLSEVYLRAHREQDALAQLNAYAARKSDASVWLQIGLIQQRLSNFPAARDAYEKVLTVNPKSGAALNNAAYLYSEKLNNLAKASEYADRARQLFPKDPAVLDTAGWVEFKRGNFANALPLFRQSAQALPRDPEPQFHLGLAYYMLGQEQAARTALNRAVELGTNFYGRAEAERRLELLAIDAKTADATALGKLESSVRAEPTDFVALSRLAAIYQRDGAAQKAVAACDAALKQNPQNARLLDTLSQVYALQLNNPAKALEYAKDAHKAAPEDARICQNLARLAYRSGDYKWALSLFQEAAPRLPEDPELQYDLALASYSLGRLKQAEAAMKKALGPGTAFPHEEEARQFLMLLACYYDPEQMPGAAAQVEQILAKNPDHTPALMISAGLQARSGKQQQARQIYDRILARNQFFSPAARELTVFYPEGFSDDAKAYDLAVKAREAFPEDPRVARALGILTFKREEYPRSVQLLKESAARMKNDPQLAFYLGMAQYRLKSYTDARTNLSHALALQVPSPLAEQAKATLAELKP